MNPWKIGTAVFCGLTTVGIGFACWRRILIDDATIDVSHRSDRKRGDFHDHEIDAAAAKQRAHLKHLSIAYARAGATLLRL
jgi:hypothetical protein